MTVTSAYVGASDSATNKYTPRHTCTFNSAKTCNCPKAATMSAAANWGEECAVRQFNWSILAHKLEMNNFLCVPHFGAAVALQHDNY